MIEEVVGVIVSNNVTDVCPANIDPREDCETSNMRTDGLGIVSTNIAVIGATHASGVRMLLRNKTSMNEIKPVMPYLLITKKEVNQPWLKT